MHDPSTVAFTIRYPWRQHRDSSYREPIVTIWHEDPETDGSDDSCGWFPRARHGDPAVLEKIRKRIDDDFDRTWFDEEGNRSYARGMFWTTGVPRFSPIGIVLNIFFIASIEHFGNRRRAAGRFMQRRLFDIALFAENPWDSVHDSIVLTFGNDKRERRIEQLASVAYGYVLRESRPWYRHPRWHVWHWHVQVHAWERLRRSLLTRCVVCGRGFRYGEAPCTSQWDRVKPKFLRGETGLYHDRCMPKSAKPAC